MECAGRVANHVKVFFIRKLGKYLILKFSLFGMSPALVKYQAICSTVDSFISPANLVNLGTFHPLGSSVCNTYSANGDVYFGLCRPMFIPFCAITLSTMTSRLFSTNKFSCQTPWTTRSASWFRFTTRTGGSFAATMPSPVLLDDCSPLLLFLGFTIFLTYLLIDLLTSFLIILSLLNLMHTHKFEKFHKWRTLCNFKREGKKKSKFSHKQSH